MRGTEWQIFIDVDGVLADFCGATLKRLGIRPDFAWPVGIYRMDLALGCPEPEIWRAIDDVEFWSTLDVLPMARDLVRTLAGHGRARFCTSPSALPECGGAKARWLRERFGDITDASERSVLVMHDKWLCAGPRRLLVDDHAWNVEQWRLCGGRAVLWPAPWNGRYSEAAGWSVERCVAEAFSAKG